MLKVIHGADFHLDAPFHALPPEKAAGRRAEQRELLFRLADLANREGADLVLLSGDLFDGAEIYGETLEALENATLEELTAVDDIGEITARSVLEWMASPQSRHLMARLREAGVNTAAAEKGRTSALRG